MHANNSRSKVRLTLVPQHVDSLHDAVSVVTRLVVIHLRRDDVTDTRAPAADGTCRAVERVGVTLLQRQHALVHVLQNVTLWKQKQQDSVKDINL